MTTTHYPNSILIGDMTNTDKKSTVNVIISGSSVNSNNSSVNIVSGNKNSSVSSANTNSSFSAYSFSVNSNNNSASGTKQVVKNSDKYVLVVPDKNKRTKGLAGSPSFLRLQSESEVPAVEEGTVTIDTSKCRSNLDVVRKCIYDLGWREFPYGRRNNSCDLYWHAINFNGNTDISSGQVSKFPGTNEMFSKSNLFRSLDFMKSLFPDDYDFYPRTWFLPQQFYQFNSVLKHLIDRKVRPKPTFIVKPSDGSQGEGIYLMREPAQYTSQGHRKQVIQEYLTNVYLIDDLKFDFRVYAVLKSINPLQIYICKEGLARFSTVPYEQPSDKNLNESFMHLTNYSLNKRSSTFDKSQKEGKGSKRKLTQVLNLLKQNGHNSEAIWSEIEEIVCKTILAVIGDLKVEFHRVIPNETSGPSCFQILGFDILLLKDLKPMLLEVNSNPSLRIDCEQEVSPGIIELVLSQKDEEVKRPLLRDTMMLVAPPNKYTKKRGKKKPKLTPEIKQKVTNLPTALVIMSKTQDISEKLLKFDFSDSKPYSSSSNFIGSNDQFSVLENNHQNLNSASTNQSGEKSGLIESNIHKTNYADQTNENREVSDSEETGIENKDREESCLKEIYPAVYQAEYKHLHVMEKLAKMFISCLSVRGTSRLSSSAFRFFTRKSRLVSKGITNAIVDLTYIDILRKWENMSQERGLNFCGFVEACQELSKRNFGTSYDKLEMLRNFIEYCQENIETFHTRQSLEDEEKNTLLNRRQQSQRTMIFPQLTSSNLAETTLHDLYGQSLRKEYLNLQQKKLTAVMLANHKRNYLPRTRLDLKSKSHAT